MKCAGDVNLVSSKMKSLCIFFASFVILIYSSYATGAQLAFVVGISKYEHIDKLDNPEIDAMAVAAKLTAAGYAVTLLRNKEAAAQPLIDSWNIFRQKVSPGDEVVIYYSGHGVDVAGANYLVPQDSPDMAHIGGTLGMKQHLIAFHNLMQELHDVQVNMQLWVIDACRTNPFAAGGRPFGGDGGLTANVEEPNRFVLYSANYAQIALDRLPSDPPDAKLGSPFSRLFVSMFDAWKGRNVRDFAAELRSNTMKSVDPSPQMPIWEDGVLTIWCLAKCEPSSVERAIAQNQEAARKLAQISRLVTRAKYPLQPNEFFYTIEYDMDQDGLKEYITRIQKEIVSFLRSARQGRGSTSDDLADESIMFNLTKKWTPDRKIKAERQVTDIFTDYTSFTFEKTQGNKIVFSCITPELSGLIVTMKQTEQIKQEVEIYADFKKRKLVKQVRCQNLVRSGDDATSFSSADLIGRSMSWSQVVAPTPLWQLTSFFMRFSYDYGFDQRTSIPERAPPNRQVPVIGVSSVKILSQHVGLDDAGLPN